MHLLELLHGGVLNDDEQVLAVGGNHDLVLLGAHTQEGEVILQAGARGTGWERE